MEAALRWSESGCKPLCPYLFTLQIYLEKSDWSDLSLWFLLHYRCWVLTETLLGYPVVALSLISCSFESVGQTPSYAPAGHRQGGCWDGPTHNPSSRPGQLQNLLFFKEFFY